jgi:diguanylate cyclase (GGDEF)-like protein
MNPCADPCTSPSVKLLPPRPDADSQYVALGLSLRLTDRRDRLLLAGLAVALLTVFDRTLGVFLRVVADVEASYGVRLLPALVVLTFIFIVHQHTKRQEMKAEAARAALEAQIARERAEELERLSALGKELAGALTVEAVQAALWRYLPSFIGEREAWVAMWHRGQCQILVNTAQPHPQAGDVNDLALLAITALGSRPDERHPVDGPFWCVPLVAGEAFIGAWGISEAAGEVGAQRAHTLEAAATVIGIALRNVQLFADLRDTALRDELTQCFNRTHLLQVLDAELRRARRTRNQLSLVMLDLDNFKALNDRRGHLAGDGALAAIGTQLRTILRQSDICCRFGGDEFAVLLPDTGLRGAVHVAENLRGEIERLKLASVDDVCVTASVGVATSLSGDCDTTTLVQRADQALYEAKRAGRNRVWFDEGAVEPGKPAVRAAS